MRKQSILKSIGYSLLFTGLAFTMAYCTKREIASATGQPSGNISAQALSSAGNPTIYAVRNGSNYLYTIDPATGNVLASTVMTWTYSSLAYPVYGIAKIPGSNFAYVTSGTECLSSNTKLNKINLTTGIIFSMGSGAGMGTTPITDIECDPITGNLYGICGNFLVRIINTGSGCPGTPGMGMVFEILGNLSSVGVGPYSVSFDYLGNCAIMSAKDQRRDFVNLPSTGYPSSTTPSSIPNIITQHNYPYPIRPSLWYSVSDVASCISGLDQFIGVSGYPSSSSSLSNFYIYSADVTNPYGGTYQLLATCNSASLNMSDYTSIPTNGSK